MPHDAQTVAPERILHHLDTWAVAYVHACLIASESVSPDHLVATRLHEYPEAGVPFHDIVLEGSEPHPYVGVHSVTTVVDDPVTAQDNVVPEDHVNTGAVPARIATEYGFEVEVVIVDSITDKSNAARTDMYALLTIVMDIEVTTNAVRPANHSHSSA